VASEFVCGEYDEVEEELKELDEGHDGEAEPQTKNTARVGDVLQQLTTTTHTHTHTHTAVLHTYRSQAYLCD